MFEYTNAFENKFLLIRYTIAKHLKGIKLLLGFEEHAPFKCFGHMLGILNKITYWAVGR